MISRNIFSERERVNFLFFHTVWRLYQYFLWNYCILIFDLISRKTLEFLQYINLTKKCLKIINFFSRTKMFSNSGLEPKKGKFTNLNTFTENKILKESTSLISQRRTQLISSLTHQRSHLVNPILQKYETKLPSTPTSLTFQTKFTNLTNSQLNKPWVFWIISKIGPKSCIRKFWKSNSSITQILRGISKWR